MKRHRWGKPTRPDLNNTFRTCANCGLVRIIRHEQDNNPRHWTEFRHGKNRVVMHGAPNKTPPCGGYDNILRSADA